MIATILHSSKSFNAVDYNERKVAKGTAELLEIKNFKYLQTMGFLTPTDLKRYLMDYSSRNDRIQNAQFHVAISCKGQEYTKEQLLEIAHKYLKEMGYGAEEQPVLVYAHHDTNNNHIHIVTSRIAPDGHKIDHNNERIRSMEAINRIMGVNRKKETKDIVNKAFAYSFSSLGQFKAVIESSGYECFENEKEMNIKKDGKVMESVPLPMIHSHITPEKKSETAKRKRQLKAILAKYRQMATDKEELKLLMKKKFGVDLIFVGSKDTPHGYHVVDHKGKTVYKGSEIMPIKELVNFSQKTQDKSYVEEYITNQLKDSPRLSLYDINKLLWRRFSLAITQKGQVQRGIKKIHLYDIKKDLLATLRMNGKIAWIQTFSPKTETERSMLCRVFHIDEKNIKIEQNADNSIKQQESARHLHDIIDHTETDKVFENLHEGGFFIVRNDEHFHAIDMRNNTIVDFSEFGIDSSKLLNRNNNQQSAGHISKGKQPKFHINDRQIQKTTKQLLESDSNGDINREWEVGTHDNWDDLDNQLKR